MTNFVPIFPLSIVVYPFEVLNLHIFEAKYKQLIKECIEEQKPFAILPVVGKKTQEYGTSLQVVELVKEYDNGEMDIRAKGIDVLRVLDVVKDVPDKLYSGAIVNHPENILERDTTKLADTILSEVKRMYSLLNVEEKFPVFDDDPLSYKIAHYIGLSQEQEYELLQLLSEIHRLEYIRKYLNQLMPSLEGLERAKARIKMNGHFRDLSLGDLEL